MSEQEIICKFYDKNLDKLPKIIDKLTKEELELLKNKIIISDKVKTHQLRIMQTFLNKLSLFSLCESKERMEYFIRNPKINLNLELNNTTTNHTLNDSLYVRESKSTIILENKEKLLNNIYKLTKTELVKNIYLVDIEQGLVSTEYIDSFFENYKQDYLEKHKHLDENSYKEINKTVKKVFLDYKLKRQNRPSYKKETLFITNIEKFNKEFEKKYQTQIEDEYEFENFKVFDNRTLLNNEPYTLIKQYKNKM